MCEACVTEKESAVAQACPWAMDGALEEIRLLSGVQNMVAERAREIDRSRLQPRHVAARASP